MKSKDFINVMGTPSASPEEICRNIASDFKLMGLTQAKAAAQLGIDPKAVANQISGKRAFGKKAAKLYAKAFGYNEAYLLYGEGGLKEGPMPATVKVTVPNTADETITISLKDFQALKNRVELLEKFVTMLDIQPKNTSSDSVTKKHPKKETHAQQRIRIKKEGLKLK